MAYKCTNPWTTCFIWKNGDVTHCCYSSAGAIGNIHKQSLEEIWQGKKINKIRDNIGQNKYQPAGCEYFCRPYRWSKIYDEDKKIPEGLGRIPELNQEITSTLPQIIGIEFDGHCNMHCTHCLGSHDHNKGLDDESIHKLEPYLKQAKILRIVGGEFSVNPRNLSYIQRVSTWDRQPTLFLNTNGKVSVNRYLEDIDLLQSLHMKFSLEGMNEAYERIRVGGKWDDFNKHLDDAVLLFREKQEAGLDWRLYLNYCVMRHNFKDIPNILAYAISKGLPLVVNTLNGMRHVDENMFVYGHLEIPSAEIADTIDAIEATLKDADYPYEAIFRDHFDYILKVMNLPKLAMNESAIRGYINRHRENPISGDRGLYIKYRFQQSKLETIRYLVSKVIKRMRHLIR